MKTKFYFLRLLLIGILFALLFNCKKKEEIKTAPTVTISAVTNITSSSATSGGDVTSDGGATVTAKGICYGTNQNSTTSDSKTTSGTGTGSFTSSITGLNPGNTYYIRTYATNSVGTGYSSQATFTTIAIAPVLTTADATAITSNAATSGGNITNDGGSAVTVRGICWSTIQNPTTANSKTTDGTGTGNFTSNLTGLLPGTVYFVKAYATNSIGTTYGNQVTLTTTAVAPVLTTTAVSAIASTTAISGGNITSDGGSAVTSRGVCWASTQNPTTSNSKTTDGTGSGIFSSNLTGLSENTTYYLRAYATNSTGTAFGSEISFKTSATASGTVTDIDGNVYHYITIGTQVWMVENLKTTKYRNGDPIPNVTDNLAWIALATSAYCWYNNDATKYKADYGALYNWYAVADSRNIAPVGWHVPTDDEWTTLTTYLGGASVAGGKLKELGTTHWQTPNTGATNSSGFTALPGGSRSCDYGTFNALNLYCDWWSTTSYASVASWFLDLSCNSATFNRYGTLNQYGFSVRCVRD